MRWNFEQKARFLGLLFLFTAIFFIGRLYFLQIVHGDYYKEKIVNENVRVDTPIFDRGSIYFKNKDETLFLAGGVRSGYTLSINPSLIKDKEMVYEKLSKIIELDKDSFIKKASKSDDPYEEVVNRLKDDLANKIKDLKLEGVSLVKEKWRIYPGDSLGAHVVGFVGYDSSNDIYNGRYGLERYYEDNLKRVDNFSKSNFFAELFSNAKKLTNNKDELESDIVTSIEPKVEKFLEDKLKEVSDQYGSKMTGGIIMDPYTGKIFAMALNPTFNPNKYNHEKNVSVFSNSLIEGVYEMGSIVKPITMASALDTDTVTASTTYKDEGFLKVNDRTIYNFDFKGRGVVNMQEVLNQSLNTGVATISLKMGKKKFSDYIKNFGIGEETGIDLPSEAGGKLQNLEKGGDVELANASFGQGISTSPIAMIRALSALGNGGLLPNPHVVEKLNYKIGLSKEIIKTEEEMQRVIKKETSEEITRMLVNVVDKALKGGTVKMQHYSIAAKTGTAQIAETGGKGYSKDRYLHSFFGYFPAYNPKFIVFLYTIEPKANYASETLTDPFMDIVKFLIHYYEVPPDR
jgi:cell division protein FtsI/penicillin-binding protein 2